MFALECYSAVTRNELMIWMTDINNMDMFQRHYAEPSSQSHKVTAGLGLSDSVWKMEL